MTKFERLVLKSLYVIIQTSFANVRRTLWRKITNQDQMGYYITQLLREINGELKK
jgi:hypothetical protein